MLLMWGEAVRLVWNWVFGSGSVVFTTALLKSTIVVALMAKVSILIRFCILAGRLFGEACRNRFPFGKEVIIKFVSIPMSNISWIFLSHRSQSRRSRGNFIFSFFEVAFASLGSYENGIYAQKNICCHAVGSAIPNLINEYTAPEIGRAEQFPGSCKGSCKMLPAIDNDIGFYCSRSEGVAFCLNGGFTLPTVVYQVVWWVCRYIYSLWCVYHFTK